MTKVNRINYASVTKFLGVALLCAVLAISMVWPAPARAQSYTVAELQSLLSQILVQLQQLQSGSASSGVCPYIWTRNLGQGSTGADVMRLQQFLNASADTRLALSGAGAPGMETQYYGPITAAAVSKFHVKYRAEILTPLGLVNPTGYFGAMSRAKANALCASAVVPPPVSGDDPLRGGAGTLADVRLMADISNEDVGEGQNDVDVLGLELRAEGSDVELTAVTVDFEQVSHSGNFNRYADEVSIWLDGEEYATVDADQFTRSNDYRRTITLDRGAIIRQGDVGELVVAVSAVGSIDSSRFGDQWEVSFDSVRFRDAMNAFITDTAMSSLSRTMTFQEFASSVGLRVTVRNGDSDINNARVIEVSPTSRTNNTAVLSFVIEVEGDSDVLIDDLTLSATTTGATLEKVISAAYLYRGNDRVASESITSAANSITFDGLDLELAGDRRHEFELRVDLREADGTNYSSGATIDVDITTADRNNWFIEDERGDTVATADRRGSASADAHTLQTEGAMLRLVSSNTSEVYNSSTPSASYGEFRMVVEVEAIGDTIYVAETATRDDTASAGHGATYYFQDGSGNEYAAGVGTQSFSRISGGSMESGFVRINEGQTARFELVATLDPAAFGQYRAQLVSVGWNDTAATPDSTTAATPTSNYRTSLQTISN